MWLDIGKSCGVCLDCEAIAVYTSGNQEDCGFAETARRWNLRPPSDAERLASAVAVLARHHCAEGCEVERFSEEHP